MKKLNTILLSIWGFVILYILILININATSWAGVIGLIFIFFGMVVVCIASGMIGYSRYNNGLIPACINAAGSMIAVVILAGKSGDPSYGIALVTPGAFLITLISAAISFVFTGKPISSSTIEPEKEKVEPQEQASHPLPPVIRYPLIGLIFIGLYLLVAYCSQFELFPVEKETHWKENKPPADAFTFEFVPKELWATNYIPEYYIFDKDGNLFTGIIERYKSQLRINPFRPSPQGVDYYMNGQRWGLSVAGYRVTEPFEYNYHNRIKKISFEDSFPPYLIYIQYSENIHKILKKYAGDYIILPTEDPYLKILLSFNEEKNEIHKMEITYHTNRIINSIEWKDTYSKQIKMDRLGFIDTEYSSELEGINRHQKWKRDDFIFVDILPDPLQEGETTGEKKETLINNIHSFLIEHPDYDPEIATLFLNPEYQNLIHQ